jgi:hypothetical protein
MTTTITFDIDDTIDVNAGKDIKLDVDMVRLAPLSDVHNYIYRYGLKQILADSHSAMTKEKEPVNYKTLSRPIAMKKLDALYAGDVSAMGERSRFEPVEREARRMATIDLARELKSKGKKLIKSTDMAALVNDNWRSYEQQAADFLKSVAKDKPVLNLKALGL